MPLGRGRGGYRCIEKRRGHLCVASGRACHTGRLTHLMHAIGRSRCAGLTGAGDWTVAQVEDSLGAGDSVAEGSLRLGIPW